MEKEKEGPRAFQRETRSRGWAQANQWGRSKGQGNYVERHAQGKAVYEPGGRDAKRQREREGGKGRERERRRSRQTAVAAGSAVELLMQDRALL